jgi:hypothetical protein
MSTIVLTGTAVVRFRKEIRVCNVDFEDLTDLEEVQDIEMVVHV